MDTGAVSLVRDVITSERSELNAETAVYEVRRTDGGAEGRYLTAEERTPIIEALQKLYAKEDSYAAFSWDELEEVGAWDVQDLAVRYDDVNSKEQFSVATGDSHNARMISVNRSIGNWGDGGVAYSMHLVASAHHLVVHSA